MTGLEIQKMKETETLVMTKGRLFWHYSFILFLLFVPVLTTIDVFKYYVTHTYRAPRPIEDIISTGYIWVMPAIALYFIQKRRLKFKVLNIGIDPDTFKTATEQTARELEWEIQTKTNDLIVAHRHWNWTGSWGEMITIIRDKDRILINSICDPDNRPSVASWGMNKVNIKTFEQYVRKTAPNSSLAKAGLTNIA
jgi:hypothetical protein